LNFDGNVFEGPDGVKGISNFGFGISKSFEGCFKAIYQGVTQGVVALLGEADFILLGEVFDEDGGRHEESSKFEIGISNLERLER
jgi:hypothetical protein